MTIPFDEVFAWFSRMSKLSLEECAEYHDLIGTSIRDVEKRLRPDAGGDGDMLLSQLAAASAYYRYVVMNHMASTNINTLDLTVSVDYTKQMQAARRLRDEFSVMAKDYLEDTDGFLFLTV